MSLNTSHAANGVVLYAGEFILLYCDGVTLAFECNEPNMKGSKKGRLYLTTHRMIFRSNEDSKGLLSFSFPFHTISELGLEQPVFGANYIKGRVTAEPSGGWTGSANFKLTFKNGGAIEYGQALMAAAQAASRDDGLLCTVIEKWCLGTGGPSFATRAFHVVVPHAKVPNANPQTNVPTQEGRPSVPQTPPPPPKAYTLHAAVYPNSPPSAMCPYYAVVSNLPGTPTHNGGCPPPPASNSSSWPF